ncbi:transcription repressor NadR [Peptostreptococcus faecalis]|uniref:transcription repressor NadR n=1 Tax=Peptostreptococcus faecalis TaxID=2045015 RepID=UPI0015E0D604|nr:transcription repressor NadR [Peptostreptococcus faecalis]
MSTSNRRDEILEILKSEEKPISAKKLADIFGVSRQIIVGDIALIRASEVNIISTNRGYLLDKSDKKIEKGIFSRKFKVKHSANETKEELYLIVDAGCRVVDVRVEHKIYGEIGGALNISNRREVDQFISSLDNIHNIPLSSLTNSEHFHLVESTSKENLDYAEEMLKKRGFLIEG